MWVGNGHFELPPGKPEVTVVGTCSENCSKKIFKKPFFVSAAMNHMHYLGELSNLLYHVSLSKFKSVFQDVYTKLLKNPNPVKMQKVIKYHSLKRQVRY